MTRSYKGKRILKMLLLAYIIGLFVASALALPGWNSFMRDSVGRILSIEQIHVLEYMGLGIIAAVCFRTPHLRWSAQVGLWGGLVLVGLCDELFQLVLPQRSFQWSDVFLNTAGVFLGFSFFEMLLRIRRLCRLH